MVLFFVNFVVLCGISGECDLSGVLSKREQYRIAYKWKKEREWKKTVTRRLKDSFTR